MKLLDKKSLGYLNYTNFSQVFSPNMSTKLVQYDQKDTYFNNLQPNKDTNTENMNNQVGVMDKIKTIRKGFQPDMDPSKCPNKVLIIYRTCSTNEIQQQTSFRQYFCEFLTGEEWTRICFRARETWQIDHKEQRLLRCQISNLHDNFKCCRKLLESEGKLPDGRQDEINETQRGHLGQ